MKPILFNTEMVQAILDGRKTQTRRVIKPQPNLGTVRWDGERWTMFMGYPLGHDIPIDQYGGIGDTLYVRETWAMVSDYNDIDHEAGVYEGYIYRAHWPADEEPKWRPSIHMPKKAARIFLKITDVRIEQLQETTATDCIKEGIVLEWSDEMPKPPYLSPAYAKQTVKPAFIKAYRELWDGIYAKRGYGWEVNPWVFVISFERIDKPEEEQ